MCSTYNDIVSIYMHTSVIIVPLDLLAFEANISLFKTNIEMYSVIITAPLFSFSNTTGMNALYMISFYRVYK